MTWRRVEHILTSQLQDTSRELIAIVESQRELWQVSYGSDELRP